MKRTKTRPHIVQEILTLFKQRSAEAKHLSIGQICEGISREIELKQGETVQPKTIYGMIRRLQPTTDLAETYIKSQAFRLAARVVRKANTAEAIDILSRPNVGVLSPKSDAGGAGGGGFFLSVSADSCGAVKVGLTNQPPPQLQPAPDCNALHLAETSTIVDIQEAVDGNETDARPHSSGQRQGRIGDYSKPEAEWSSKHQDAIAAARARVTKERSRRQSEVEHTKRAKRYQKDTPVQGADESSDEGVLTHD